MEPFEILETDEVGRATATYIVSFSASALSRVDAVRTVNKLPLIQRFLGVFLPTGYPHTVSSDYTPYQIYNSLQAFFSAIAGLLASRAVVSSPFTMSISKYCTMPYVYLACCITSFRGITGKGCRLSVLKPRIQAYPVRTAPRPWCRRRECYCYCGHTTEHCSRVIGTLCNYLLRPLGV